MSKTEFHNIFVVSYFKMRGLEIHLVLKIKILHKLNLIEKFVIQTK